MHIRYRELFNLNFNNTLYNSLINDKSRMIITRWRLSCHRLKIETGRYHKPYIERNNRVCNICNVLEDENHALFFCRAHRSIRRTHRNIIEKLDTINQMLNPQSLNDLILVSNYLHDIEKNMEAMNMI